MKVREVEPMMKLVVEGKSQRVLGVHMVGEYPSEIIQSIAIAIKLGTTKNDFDSSVGFHPSIAEEIFTI